MGEGLLEKILARLEAIETRLAGQTVTATLGETVNNDIPVVVENNTPVTIQTCQLALRVLRTTL